MFIGFIRCVFLSLTQVWLNCLHCATVYMASAMSGAKVLCSMATELLHEAKGEAILVESDVQTDGKTQVAFLGIRISIKEALEGQYIDLPCIETTCLLKLTGTGACSPQHQGG